jgi:hypothetical protein
MPSIRARSVAGALTAPLVGWFPEGYQADLRAYYAEQHGVKRDEIAGRQLHTLRQYQAPDEKKFRLADVKRLFELMKDLT